MNLICCDRCKVTQKPSENGISFNVIRVDLNYGPKHPSAQGSPEGDGEYDLCATCRHILKERFDKFINDYQTGPKPLSKGDE